MTQRKPSPAPAPVPLRTRGAIRAVVRDLYEHPLKPAERLVALRLLVTLAPDEDAEFVRAELERLLPTVRAPRDRLKLLAFAADALPEDERPKSFAEWVLAEMAADA